MLGKEFDLEGYLSLGFQQGRAGDGEGAGLLGWGPGPHPLERDFGQVTEHTRASFSSAPLPWGPREDKIAEWPQCSGPLVQ